MQPEAEAQNRNAKETTYLEQDKEIAELITSAMQLIERVEASSEAMEVLQGYGYKQDQFDEGRNLCNLTQESFTRRQELLNQQKRLSAILHAKDREVYKSFSDLRVIARALFRKSEDRSGLGVSGRRSRDRQRMITMLSVCADAALKQPYLDVLSRHGYDAESMARLKGQAEELRLLDNEQDMSMIKAREATRIRDEAAAQLEGWAGSFRAIARRALRDSPELVDVLNM